MCNALPHCSAQCRFPQLATQWKRLKSMFGTNVMEVKWLESAGILKMVRLSVIQNEGVENGLARMWRVGQYVCHALLLCLLYLHCKGVHTVDSSCGCFSTHWRKVWNGQFESLGDYPLFSSWHTWPKYRGDFCDHSMAWQNSAAKLVVAHSKKIVFSGFFIGEDKAFTATVIRDRKYSHLPSLPRVIR